MYKLIPFHELRNSLRSLRTFINDSLHHRFLHDILHRLTSPEHPQNGMKTSHQNSKSDSQELNLFQKIILCAERRTSSNVGRVRRLFFSCVNTLKLYLQASFQSLWSYNNP